MRRHLLERERGATLVEYALLVALIVVVSLGAIQSLETKGKSKVDDGASDRGLPSEQLFLPSPSGSIIGGGSGSTVGSGAATVEVFDLVGSSADAGGTGPPTWVASATVRVKNVATPDLWNGVTVAGTWTYLEGSTPRTVVRSCVTANTGVCTITLTGLRKEGGTRTDSATFGSITLSGTGIVHQPPSPDPISTGPIPKP